MRTTLRITILILSIQLATGAADSNESEPSNQVHQLLIKGDYQGVAKALEAEYRMGLHLLIKGDYRGTIKVLDKVVPYTDVLDPNVSNTRSHARLCRGIARAKAEDYEGAAEDFFRARFTTLELTKNESLNNAQESVLSNCRGLTLMEAGQYYRAAISFDDAMLAFFSLSSDDAIHERWDKVLVGYKAWIDDKRLRELIPDFTTTYIGWRITIAILEEYLADQFDLTPALISCQKGLARGEFGQLTDSIKSYNRAIASKPDLALAYIGRGTVKQKLELYSDALRDFDKAIELSHNDALAYYFRGEAAYKLGKIKTAQQDMQTALREVEQVRDNPGIKAYIENITLRYLIKATISSYSDTPKQLSK